MSLEREAIREQLSAYIDGELSAQETRSVEQAVRQDPLLAAELRALRGVRERLLALPRLKAPGDMAGRILAKTAAPSAYIPAARRWQLASRWAAAAGILLVFGTGFGLFLTWQQAGRVTVVSAPARSIEAPRALHEQSAEPSEKAAGEKAAPTNRDAAGYRAKEDASKEFAFGRGRRAEVLDKKIADGRKLAEGEAVRLAMAKDTGHGNDAEDRTSGTAAPMMAGPGAAGAPAASPAGPSGAPPPVMLKPGPKEPFGGIAAAGRPEPHQKMMSAAGAGVGGDAKTGLQAALADGDVVHLCINTPDLSQAQREVDGLLKRNQVAQVTVVEQRRRDDYREQAQVFSQQRQSVAQLRYDISVDDELAGRIVKDLDALRARGEYAKQDNVAKPKATAPATFAAGDADRAKQEKQQLDMRVVGPAATAMPAAPPGAPAAAVSGGRPAAERNAPAERRPEGVARGGGSGGGSLAVAPTKSANEAKLLGDGPSGGVCADALPQKAASSIAMPATHAASQPARPSQLGLRGLQANMRQIVVILNGPAMDAASGPSH